MKRKLVLSCGILMFSLISIGQNVTNDTMSSDFEQETKLIETILNENSDTEEAFFNVKKKPYSVIVKIRATLKRGKFKIEIYDPKGKKYQRNLIIDSQCSFGNDIKLSHENLSKETSFNERSVSDKTIGSFYIAIKKPQDGKWKIQLQPEEAIGNIQISYSVLNIK